ncbi:MAG: exodeoxyribonuclease III [Mollicutes bacterium]|nr:exodeoxyribonuclease III [Mollicutes bacterium]MDD7263491.1 exodeoxyribonuclease III [bacterium]MDY4979739.1 exodeoxyribonuclease III [Candidatus Onthovivens sp.]
MRIISRNVNGIRACLNKGLNEFINNFDPDIACFQETKMQIESNFQEFSQYPYQYYSNAIKKGYSGTLVLSKIKPINVIYGIDGEYDDEGRAITLEFNDFYLINVYSPNSKEELLRLSYRMEYEDKLRKYLLCLSLKKPVILCGDLNVAHEEIDIKNPKNNLRSAGFTIEERTKFTELLNNGFIDTFRFLHPSDVKYSWWSYRFKAREKNAGWRIDYFVVSKDLLKKVKNSLIFNDVFGSDHCPICLDLYN